MPLIPRLSFDSPTSNLHYNNTRKQRFEAPQSAVNAVNMDKKKDPGIWAITSGPFQQMDGE